MDNRYLFIAEDGGLTISSEIQEEVFQAFIEGIWDIVDMETGLQYTGDGEWEPIEVQGEFKGE